MLSCAQWCALLQKHHKLVEGVPNACDTYLRSLSLTQIWRLKLEVALCRYKTYVHPMITNHIATSTTPNWGSQHYKLVIWHGIDKPLSTRQSRHTISYWHYLNMLVVGWRWVHSHYHFWWQMQTLECFMETSQSIARLMGFLYVMVVLCPHLARGVKVCRVEKSRS